MTIRAAIYARSSPDCLLSSDQQIDLLTTVAGERVWAVTSIFSDRPTSVKRRHDRRAGELALIDAIESGTIDRVLVWSIDRIGKSLIDLVGFLDTCRAEQVSLWVDQQKLDTAMSNGLSLFDMAAMMALHLRQTRRDKILRGQSAARALSIKFGRPRIATIRVEKAKRELAAGKGVRQVARLAGISPTSACRIKNLMNAGAARI